MPDPIAHYEPQGALGRGAVGITYRSRDTRVGTAVALKLIHPELARDPDIHARLRLAARVASQIDHPNIARVVDFGDDGDTSYIATPLVDGVDLNDILQGEGRLSPAETRRIAIGMDVDCVQPPCDSTHAHHGAPRHPHPRALR